MNKDFKKKTFQNINNINAVFICGCGRSGTTYIRSVVDAHPDIFIPTESLFIVDYLLYARYIPKGLAAAFFFSEPQLKAWYSGPAFKFSDPSDAIMKIHLHAAAKKGARIWGQKTPRFVRYVDLFNKNFKGIKWILVYRDPRAVVASMLKSKRHTYSISRACNRWNRDNNYIIQRLKSSEKRDDMFFVQYEHFVGNFETFIRAIFEYLGVPPISKEEVISRGTTPPLKGSRFDVITVRDGLAPHKKNIDNWKRFLTRQQITEIEKSCADGMEILGYTSISNLKDSKYSYKGESAWGSIKDFLIFIEYIKKWPSYLIHTVIRKTVFGLCYLIYKVERKIENI